jgi:hypothetical protein
MTEKRESTCGDLKIASTPPLNDIAHKAQYISGSVYGRAFARHQD